MKRPRIIGERANTAGSQTFHQLIAAEDWNTAVDFTLAQVREGADFIDVCLMSPEGDELRSTSAFYTCLREHKHPPVFIDSLSPEVMEVALGLCGPGATLNSASLEDPDQLKRVCALARSFRASIVVACRDYDGLAITAEQKWNVARRALSVLTEEHQIDPASVIFDVIALPLYTSPDALRHTLRGIEIIHGEMPQTRTLMGLSNISFGMPHGQRPELERSVLEKATPAGLDFVILNTSRHGSQSPHPRGA